MLYLSGLIATFVVAGIYGGRKVNEQKWPMVDYTMFMILALAVGVMWPFALAIATVMGTGYGLLKGFVYLTKPRKKN